MAADDVPPEITSLFSKRFAYPKDPRWRVPASWAVLATPHQEFPHLLSIKESLNGVKNLLSDKKLDQWHSHTAYTNMAGRVVPEVRRQANAELCTQAWCKFYELAATYPLLPQQALWAGELNSVHLCEAPGAFIASLNHYIKTQALRCDWTWVANTLNPYHESNRGMMMIADDRLIANTLPWWYFGPDNTGDIMGGDYLRGLQTFIGNMAAVHLVTADGSFDCQGDPGEQESLVYPLHYCEVVTALSVLSNGGSFILKMFTLLQHSSVNLLYLLNCCFREVHVVKPGTSKAGNSEVYVVGLGYAGQGSMREVLAAMTAHMDDADLASKALFSHQSLPASFMEGHTQCCDFFYRHQTSTILHNLRLFSRMEAEERERLDFLRQAAVLYYLQRFQVKSNPRRDWLVRKPRVGCSLNPRWSAARSRRTETYNERKRLEALSWSDKVVQGFFTSWMEEHVGGVGINGCLLEGSRCGLRCEDWYVVRGRRLSTIHSSAFCEGQLLNAYNESLEKGEAEEEAASLPQCPACSLQMMEDLVSQILHRVQDGGHVVVVSAWSLFEALKARHWAVGFVEACPPQRAWSVLHDGDLHYQRRLWEAVICALQQLHGGGVLVLPILSSLTRFTAGIIYILYHCFQVIGFSCPTSHLTPGTDAVLMSWGYQPLPWATLEHLQQLFTERVPGVSGTERVPGVGSTEQVVGVGCTEQVPGVGGTEQVVGVSSTEWVMGTERVLGVGSTEQVPGVGSSERVVGTEQVPGVGSMEQVGGTKPILGVGSTEQVPGVGSMERVVSTEQVPGVGSMERVVSTERVPGVGSTEQVLEFIPMEELLAAPFLEFLWDLNAAIIKHNLHLIGRRERDKVLPKADQSAECFHGDS